MKLNYIKSQSSVKPDLVDTTSSKVVVASGLQERAAPRV